ncbi:GPI mannosyltransferase 2 [Phaeosphaeriaceae sp. PMI808]|nr:GPI mannosyltransferase 2 [Phaeosphaeriaceae sp. PMI808]
MEKSHRRQLVLIFSLWKGLLHLLAAFCPGPGYDTSAVILLDPSTSRHENFTNLSRYNRLVLNLMRWDALYFVKAAERGKIYEQEWAFSWAYSWLLGTVGRLSPTNSSEIDSRQYIVAGAIISNVCHLLSVLVLYHLLILTSGSQRHQISFVGSVLHIMTPASLFYSAPYAEAMFSLLHLSGMLLYVQSKVRAQTQRPSVQEDACRLGSGILFASATLMRSNGLLSGLILLYDLGRYLPRVISMRLTMHDMRRILVTSVAGSFIALGFFGPQYLAYTKFCFQDANSGGALWCKNSIPSIYSWVQSHYWNIGLFRYWTLSNLPLFLMAAPMLWLLLASSVTVLHSRSKPPSHGRPVSQGGATAIPSNLLLVTHHAPELALPQMILAITALTSFHVQIVNRIASGYPMWYFVVATWLVDEQTASSSVYVQRRNQWYVRGMIMYALIQGILFANFLPPA